jgi:hypothetical protein
MPDLRTRLEQARRHVLGLADGAQLNPTGRIVVGYTFDESGVHGFLELVASG